MYRLRLFLFALLWLPLSAFAGDNWQFSGFGSLSMARLSDDNLTFLDYDNKKWRYEGDTVLGLQLTGNLMDRLSLTAQVVSRGYDEYDPDSFEPQLEWLFLAYQLDSQWRVRLGRMRTPHYMYSETIDVGYTYIWARPPIDVYATIMSPFSHFDGADIQYLTTFNDMELDIRLFGGHINKTRPTGEIEIEPMIGTDLRLQKGNYGLHYSLMYDRINVYRDYGEAFTTALDQIITFAPEFQAVKDGTFAKQNWYVYQALGLTWNGNRLSLNSEIFDIRNTDNGYTNDAHGGYLSAHTNLGSFTPYVVSGYFLNDFNPNALNVSENSLEQTPVGIPGLEAFDQLRVLTRDHIIRSNFGQRTWTLGVRYDAFSNVALKAEWQRFDFTAGNSGQFTRTNNEAPGHIRLVTFIIDVVF